MYHIYLMMWNVLEMVSPKKIVIGSRCCPASALLYTMKASVGYVDKVRALTDVPEALKRNRTKRSHIACRESCPAQRGRTGMTFYKAFVMINLICQLDWAQGRTDC